MKQENSKHFQGKTSVTICLGMTISLIQKMFTMPGTGDETVNKSDSLYTQGA